MQSLDLRERLAFKLEVMIGEFPNLSTEDRLGILVMMAVLDSCAGTYRTPGVQALPPWLPDRPGWSHAAFYAEAWLK